MKFLMEPGGALLIMAVVAFFARFLLRALPLVGGLLNVVCLFAIAFGVIGGIFLLTIGRPKQE